MNAHPTLVPWQDVDTVLLDMDGTLLDLAFDNFFWLDLVPARYAALHGLDAEHARIQVLNGYRDVVGTLAWYCVDHWTLQLGLDIGSLKWEHRHLISYLPGAEAFLSALRDQGKEVSIVTNAHPRTLAVKTAQTGLDRRVDRMVSSHDLAAPKESLEFWRELQRRRPFDPERTLLVEDSVPVLTAARAYGVRHTIAIRRPDSSQALRIVEGFPAVDGIFELIGSPPS